MEYCPQISLPYVAHTRKTRAIPLPKLQSRYASDAARSMGLFSYPPFAGLVYLETRGKPTTGIARRTKCRRRL